MTQDEERKLLKAVLSKDKLAFERFIKQYERLIFHIVFPLIKKKEDRDDLLQDIFIKIFDKLQSFEFRSQLSTWIGNIAYNTTLNYAKRKRLIVISTQESELAFDSTDKTLNPEQQIIASELIAEVDKSINELPAIQVTILRLFHNDEMTLEAISTITNLPINTVKSHLFRARTTIKNLLLKI